MTNTIQKTTFYIYTVQQLHEMTVEKLTDLRIFVAIMRGENVYPDNYLKLILQAYKFAETFRN